MFEKLLGRRNSMPRPIRDERRARASIDQAYINHTMRRLMRGWEEMEATLNVMQLQLQKQYGHDVTLISTYRIGGPGVNMVAVFRCRNPVFGPAEPHSAGFF